uniref:Cyclin n=1 Tax=Hemiselmis tepida TaxID=464990 RepID=A0A7S0WBJ7_9CRYP|mmetsp:Transcript_7660/g.19635  ORF Transcript_7660/g.19635 Transcript_7660/m.19635 type:complete len:261 (+) Transcript_7660:171-953(+)
MDPHRDGQTWAGDEVHQEVSHPPHDDGGNDFEFDVVLEWLERECPANDVLTAGQPIPCTVFHGQRVPDITYRGYLERVRTFSGCSPCCLVVAVSYLERLAELEPDMRVTSINMHRLLLTATMVACKLFDETFYCNAYWGRVGGVPPSEMNKLELEFLFLIRFDLYRTKEQYEAFLVRLAGHAWDGRALGPGVARELVPDPGGDWGKGSPTNVVGNHGKGEGGWHRKAIDGAHGARNAPVCADTADGAAEAMGHARLDAVA